jgi:hypothetical protein
VIHLKGWMLCFLVLPVTNLHALFYILVWFFSLIPINSYSFLASVLNSWFLPECRCNQYKLLMAQNISIKIICCVPFIKPLNSYENALPASHQVLPRWRFTRRQATRVYTTWYGDCLYINGGHVEVEWRIDETCMLVSI